MILDCHYIDSELIYKTRTLENIFTEKWQQKDLKLYTKIRDIIPNEYLKIESERDRNVIVNYIASRIDKRIRFTGDINTEKFYIMLLIYKNTSMYKTATSIEVKELEKEFKYLNKKELYTILQKLHHEKVISWETRGDLNQIRF